MKYWLDIPCKDLKREWLLDEHRSVHAYFGGMLKDPDKWARSKLIGPMDPEVMFFRHEEQVQEMLARGFKHLTPLSEAQRVNVMYHRARLDICLVGQMLILDIPTVVAEMEQIQMAYLKERRKKNVD